VQVSSQFTLIPALGVTWADGKYNDRYFGVSAREAALSGLPQFTAGAGFKDASARLTATHRLTDRITLIASGGVSQLLGDVKDGPFVQKTRQPHGMVALTYRM
ncbi:MAG: MipA/OmpV family protein, partial [Caulobacter sp.]|nr:MipA/OmpV family protein [Caulobacter sp.]